MSIHLRTAAPLAGLAIIMGAVSGFGGGVDAATAQVPAQGPLVLPDCFGWYTPAWQNVIYAQPSSITFGTAGNDIIIGSDESDEIYGLGGNDRICAGDGWDYVEGGLLTEETVGDDDHIDGGTGVDVLHGGRGDDVIYGGTNFTPSDSYPYHDFLYGDSGDDALDGQSGADVLHGGFGDDYCDGGTGMAGDRPEDDSVDVYCDYAVNYETLLTAQ